MIPIRLCVCVSSDFNVQTFRSIFLESIRIDLRISFFILLRTKTRYDSLLNLMLGSLSSSSERKNSQLRL